MNEKIFIQELSQKIANYNNPEQAISQANSCDSLSNDIYTDSKRFIYELLQNADDASSQSGKLEFRIDFVGDYIIVSHKGEAFSEVDIKSICSVGDGNKKGDENKTGFKGIGFKSVFAHSEFVIIQSGKYCFKFDRQECNKWNPNWGSENDWRAGRKADYKDDEIRMPWQIIPIWSEIPNELQHYSIFNKDSYNVSTIIRHNKIEELKISLLELFSESQIVLFLRSKEIKIIINTEESLILEKSVIENTTVLKRNDQVISEWFIKTTQFEIPQNIRRQIKDNNRYPRKLRESKNTEISFAVQLEKGKLKATDDDKRLLFTYLPTSINYNFPFLINANFLTDAGRQNIHLDLEWNQWLFNQIPLNYFSWVAELALKTSKYNRQFLTILPQKLTGYNELEKNFNKGYDKAIETIAFIPSQQGELLKVSDVLFDETNISDFISKQTLVNYINSTRNKKFSILSFIPRLYPISTLKKLGIKTFELEDLEGFFTSNIFSNEHQISENFKLISFLFEQANNNKRKDEENDWNFRLKNIPFVFDEDGKLQKPEHIYFPSIEYDNEFSDEISIIHIEVLDEINKNSRIKNWLESLGIKEPTDESFIEKTIIGDEKFINSENSIKIGRYLYNAHKKGVLTENHYSKLSQINFLTQKGTLKKTQDCYISDFFEPELKLEKFCEIDFFLNTEYYEEKDLKSDWKSFFLHLKAKETIVWDKFEVRKDSINRLDYKYFENIIQILEGKQEYNGRNLVYYGKNNFYGCLFYIKSFTVYNFSFIEYAKDIIFSKLFWSNALNLACPQIQHDTVSGSSGAVGITHSLKSIFDAEYEGLFLWSIRNLEIFPTKYHLCKKSCDIFINTITQIDEIGGKYIPVLDYNNIVSPEWQETLKFKEQLKIDDYLDILTQIWQDINITEDEQKENKKRVSLIYEKLAELLPNLHDSEKAKLKSWSIDNKLLAKDGNFYLSEELSLVTVDGFNANNLIYIGKKPTDDIIKLFDLWGVKIIEKIIPRFSNSIITVESLQKQLEYITPLLALVAVEKSKSKKEWEEEYKRINNKLSEISFYETTEIQLSYGDENDLQQRSTYTEGNEFYFVGNWYKPRVLDGLVEPLCRFLKIGYAERILTVLLLDVFAEGFKYLEEKGFDISLIPDALINPAQPTFIKPDYTNRGYTETKETIGKKGELYVYERLKHIYKEKYGISLVEETIDGFKIGNNLE